MEFWEGLGIDQIATLCLCRRIENSILIIYHASRGTVVSSSNARKVMIEIHVYSNVP